MRTDIVIDRKPVICPNSLTLGYSTKKARVGDVIVVNIECGFRVGRVISRIVSGEGDHKVSLENYLVVIALGSNLSFPMERWVDPREVLECYNPKDLDLANFLHEFFSLDFNKLSVDDLRKWGSGELERPSRWKKENK